MKRGAGILICFCSGLVLSAGAKAIMKSSGDNPYQGIVERNVFGLKPPPPPPSTEPPPTPPSNIKLTGITTILGNKRALFLAQDTQPGKPPQQVSYILTEGQREGQIEVLEIDDKAGSVKIKNAGVTQSLNFDKDGVKLPNAPPPPQPLAGAPPGSPIGGGVPAPFNPSATAGGTVTTIGGSQANVGGTAANTGIRQIPTRQLRMPAAVQGQTQTQGQTITPEEQIVLMEIERERHKNNPNYPPLPPTPLTPQPTAPP